MSDFSEQIEAIATRAFRLRKSIRKVCQAAGVAPSTFSRWRAGTVEPTQETIDKLNQALDEFERESQQA